MNRKAVKPIVLILVFLGALITFSIITNKENKDLTTTMAEATLPIMQFTYRGNVLNELHGYAQEMDVLSMRDGVMPIGTNRKMNLEILTYGQNIDNLAYEIRSLDGNRLLVEEPSAKLSGTATKKTCDITLPSLFTENEEYNMVLTLKVGEKNIYYYTRVMFAKDCFVNETLDFALKFHEYTFREDAASFIPTYMDPATGDATTLNYVDLTCTLGQITWADFEGVKLTEPVASFKEINTSYNVITLNYVMTNVNELNEVEYYNVEEYYRLRQTPTRIYMLNYERRMDEIFRSENDFLINDSAIRLGIRDAEVNYMANDSGDCIAFVQEGELWCYNRTNNSISQVFSFRGMEGIDNRENWGQSDIRIVRVDEAGSIDFLVYGYMNRGDHEGKVGVGVYRYDGIGYTVEEELFIASDKSYEVLKCELGELMYVNEQKILYLMMNENVYKVDLTSLEVTTMVEGVTGEEYAVSESDRYLAWVETEKLYASTSIKMADLKTGIEYDITSGTNNYVRPIAFIGEDFVYGVAKISDVKEDSLGDLVYPMTSIQILNTSEGKLDVIKNYRPYGGYIGNVSVDADNVYVEIVKKSDGRYIHSGNDAIMNRETESANDVAVSRITTEKKQKQVTISMKPVTAVGKVKRIKPKDILVEEKREVDFNVKESDYYYVYVKGSVLLATTDASEAIHCANENYGVVVDKQMRYIWKRARSTTQSAFKKLQVNEADVNASSIAKCISIMLMREEAELSAEELVLAGQSPYEILQSALDEAKVIELKGCSAEELLYYINKGTPVLARTGKNDAVLLTGYSANLIYYYDPATGQTMNTTYDNMEQIFLGGGEYFLAYVK